MWQRFIQESAVNWRIIKIKFLAVTRNACSTKWVELVQETNSDFEMVNAHPFLASQVYSGETTDEWVNVKTQNRCPPINELLKGEL